MPPSIPSALWFKVFLANTIPLGTLTVTVTHLGPAYRMLFKDGFIIVSRARIDSRFSGGIARPGS